STSLYGGTGLGLAISKNFISLMGGTIDVESKPGFGTKFIITLKLTVAKEDTEATSPQEKNYAAISSREFDFTGKRVLLVEDHALNIEVAKKLLISRNLDVDVAENGVLAVDIIEKASQNYYDAILMDIRMPVMDGITATKTIRELPTEWTKKVPIIAMTANAFEEDIEKTKNAGMNAHLSKPIEPNILFSTLAKFIL
ncbi:MAG: response regulator, partial [Spirochaetaceae bacterium]|nr:response regulator [Spirochaetaceae bacterium]